MPFILTARVTWCSGRSASAERNPANINCAARPLMEETEMSMTNEDTSLHLAYANLDDLARSDSDTPGRIKIATDKAFDAVYAAIEEQGLKVNTTDMAEALVAHIFNFICKSNEIDPQVFAPFDSEN